MKDELITFFYVWIIPGILIFTLLQVTIMTYRVDIIYKDFIGTKCE